MALGGASALNRLNDISDTLQACEREKVCGRALPQTAVVLLAEAETLGAFSGPECAAVRLALARWRNRGTEPWEQVVGQKIETDPSVITYQQIVSALFPDLADTDEAESEFDAPRSDAGNNADGSGIETVRAPHKAGRCELHLWANWAVAASRVADKLRLVREDHERRLLTFLRELAAYEKAVRNARERESIPLNARHALHDAVSLVVFQAQSHGQRG